MSPAMPLMGPPTQGLPSGSWTSTAWQDMAQHGSQGPNTAGIRSSIPPHRQSSDHKKSEHRPSHLTDISNRAGRPQCSHAGQTQTHTMGTWSRRLGKGIDSGNGTHCRCGSPNPAIEHLTPPLMRSADQASEALASRGGSNRTIKGLLQDVIVLTLAEAEEAGFLVEAAITMTAALSTVSDRDAVASDLSPPDTSPPADKHKGAPLTPRSAAKGLGTTGAVDIPPDLWAKHAPLNWEWVKSQAVGAPDSTGPHLQALVHKMEHDGMLHRLAVDAPPNGTVFAQKKNAEKAALLFDGRPINDRCAGDPPPL